MSTYGRVWIILRNKRVDIYESVRIYKSQNINIDMNKRNWGVCEEQLKGFISSDSSEVREQDTAAATVSRTRPLSAQTNKQTYNASWLHLYV